MQWLLLLLLHNPLLWVLFLRVQNKAVAFLHTPTGSSFSLSLTHSQGKVAPSLKIQPMQPFFPLPSSPSPPPNLLSSLPTITAPKLWGGF